MLEHRAGARRDVRQDAVEPGPTRDASPPAQRLEQLVCGRPPRPARVGEHGCGRKVVTAVRGDVQNRVVVADPRRPQVPLRPLLEVVSPVDDDPRRRDKPSRSPNRHVDQLVVAPPSPRPVGHPESALVRQRGRLSPEHRRPRSLQPGPRSVVADVDALVHGHPRAPTEQTGDLGLRHARPQGLPPRDEPTLLVADLVRSHEPTVPRARRERTGHRAPLWRTGASAPVWSPG